MYEISYRFTGSNDIFSGVVLANTDVNPNSDYEYEKNKICVVICRENDNA